MNKSALLSLIFCCNIAFANCSYQSHVEYLWNKVSHERQIDSTAGFLPQDVKEFLTSSASVMEEGDRLLLAFYPTECGFDSLVSNKDRFTDLKEFYPLVHELGFKVIFCMPQHHLAQFEEAEQIKDFVCNTFHSDLSEEDPPLRFPTKIVLAELQKK